VKTGGLFFRHGRERGHPAKGRLANREDRWLLDAPIKSGHDKKAAQRLLTPETNNAAPFLEAAF
jgi:hypothetical protein